MSSPLGRLPARFTAVVRLGDGAEGGAWRAFDADAGRTVVLKHVPRARAAQVRAAFRLLRQVSSPHLPVVHELLTDATGDPWLVTGFVAGEPLQPGPAPIGRALAEAAAVAHALRAIHEAGTHHGDVSPGNVLVGPDGLFLTDFGQIGCLGCGTPGFLAPEVLAGGGGPGADVFALGSLLCVRLFGAPPWREPAAVLLAHSRGAAAVRERVAALAQSARVDVPPGLSSLLVHLLNPDVGARLADLRPLPHHLRRLGADEPEQPINLKLKTFEAVPRDSLDPAAPSPHAPVPADSPASASEVRAKSPVPTDSPTSPPPARTAVPPSPVPADSPASAPRALTTVPPSPVPADSPASPPPARTAVPPSPVPADSLDDLAPTWWLPARWPYRGAELDDAAAALAGEARPRLVAIAGPAGAGRGRVVEELVQHLQAGDGPVARVCAADRVGAALGRGDATWIAAWIAATPPAPTVLGLPDPPPWPGELADGPDDRAERRAAVLTAAAAMAEATLVLPVDDALAAALARAGGDDILVLRVRPWDPPALDALLAGVLDPPDERPAWVDALLAATGGWPGATVRAVAACARLGLARPEPAAVAAAAGSVHGELTPGQARLVLAAAWQDQPGAVGADAAHLFASDGHPLAWALAAARRVLGASVRGLARAHLDDLSSETAVPLALAVDADDAPAVARWLAAADPRLERDPALPALLAWLHADPDRIEPAARARVAAALLRAGQTREALALADAGRPGPAGELVAARALEQTGRAAEALDRLALLLADAAGDHRDVARGLRWRALTDLGRAAEALAEARTHLDEPPSMSSPETPPTDLSQQTAPVAAHAEQPARDAPAAADAPTALSHQTDPSGPTRDAPAAADAPTADLSHQTDPSDPARDAPAAADAPTADLSQRTAQLIIFSPDPARAEALLWAALAAMVGGDEPRAEAWLTGAAARLAPDREQGLHARIAQLRGYLEHLRGRVDAAVACYEQAAGHFAAAGEAIGGTLLSANLAALAIVGGDVGRGLAHGRAALRGYLALGRVQALPELAVNLMQLLVRTGSFAEAERLTALLRRLLAGGAGGPLALARCRRVEAELAFAARLHGPARRPADDRTDAAYAAAAAGLADAGAAREAADAGLRASALARRAGRLDDAARHLAAARAVATAVHDDELHVGLALEALALAVAAGGRESRLAAAAALARLPRPADLAARGRLELAWHYDQVLAAVLDPADPRRPALARRAQAVWAALMDKAPPLERAAVRAALLAESGETSPARRPRPKDEPMTDAPTRDPDPLTAVLSDLSEGPADPPPHAPPPAPPARHERLLRIYRRLAREDDLRRLLAQVVDAVMDLCDAERGVVVLGAGHGEPEPIEVTRELAGSAGVAFSRSIIARVLEQSAPVLSVDAVADDRFDGARSISHLNLRSVLAVPLLHRGEAIGAVYVDHRLRRGVWGEADLVLVEELAELAALAIAHVRMIAAQRAQAEMLAAQGRELARLLEERELEVRGLREQARPDRKVYRGIVGAGPAMQAVFRLVDRLGDSDVPVVIHGESGTGKELVARAIHDAGARKARPFVAENCGAIPEQLLESVLFGHAKGAYTGAHRATPGLFEAADGGTIFLDEIGEMSAAMQTKLLRVLQEGEVRRVGDTAVRKIDVRTIAASNRDLDAMVAAGQFRKDLLYRIRVVKLELPPLRARPDDLAALVEFFLARYDHKRRLTVSAAAMRQLARHAWPGNIRELENEVQRWVALVEARVEPADLSPGITAPAAGAADPDDLRLKPRLDHLERELIDRAMTLANGNQTRAAALLGLSRFGLQKKLRRLAGGAQEEEDD
ncbi:MAG: sigma 54-interacting transcriptional regulator [Myxococcales bacterium]|nr:sigma 54-interacting transcriptional regulator [Myxococcales bacterium]